MQRVVASTAQGNFVSLILSDVIVLLNTDNKNLGHPFGFETANVESGSQSYQARSCKNLLPPFDH